MTRERIVDRIRKLLALSASPNENEAALAAERAQELIAEHMVSMSEIGQAAKGGADKIGVDNTFMTSARPWRRQIGVALADLYFCKYGFQPMRKPGKKRIYDAHTFVGTESNRQVVQVMFAYLLTTVDRLAREGAKRVPAQDQSGYMGSFRIACALRLSERLRAKKKVTEENKTMTSTGTTLPALRSTYLAEQERIAAFVKETYEEQWTESKSRMRAKNLRGYSDGNRAAESIALDQQVNGDARRRLN